MFWVWIGVAFALGVVAGVGIMVWLDDEPDEKPQYLHGATLRKYLDRRDI